MNSVPLLTDDEVSRSIPADDEAGFGALTTARGVLPLKALDVRARIDGLLAEVEVSQTFVNPTAEALEATYVFPLPDRAALTRFRMEVAGRVVEGVLKERGQARQEYTQAVAAGHRAAITEEERPGVFTLRVGNLMPHESATVRLTLTGPLAYSDGEATFRFPLVVAPRYIPGIPLSGPGVGEGTASDTDAVPDASRISPPVLLPGFPNPVRLSLTVDVHPSDLPVGDFRSALHAVLEVVADSGVRRILVQPGERLNRDFILRFRVGDGAVRTALTLTPDSAGAREGTFALTVVPPTNPSQAARPRDVVFVLDRSGSMQGWKMVAARRALARVVDTLTERDRFTVYAFDDSIETPPAFKGLGMQPATDRNRFRAVEFLAGIDARGGTEMAQPLSLAAHQLAGATRPSERLLVLVTDGQIGNEDQILRELAPQLREVRVFALGIDQAVNAAFLRRLAGLGGGACELVESEARLDEVLEQVHRRIDTPVLRGLRLEPAGFEVQTGKLVPGRLPDLFAGAPLFVLGRYRGAPEGSVRLSATGEGGSWSAAVTGRVGHGGAATAVWARGHIRELEDRFVTGREDVRALERRIVETSLRFGVLCRFTAFLAVDRVEAPNEGGTREKVIQPVDAPAGWDMLAEDQSRGGLGLTPAGYIGGFAGGGGGHLGLITGELLPPAAGRGGFAGGGGAIHEKLNRVRRARAQITYDVETGGAMQKAELPFVIGVLADLSGHPAAPLPPLRQRRFVMVDRDNLGDVMEKIAPRLAFRPVPGVAVELRFCRLQDFEPAGVAAQVPALQPLLTGAEGPQREECLALLRAILHHQDFGRLEAAWRGLAYLVHQAETGATLIIRVLDVSRQELRKDLEAAGGVERSALFAQVYEEEYCMLGGTPYGLLVGDHAFGRDEADVRLLGGIARVAAAAHAPFVASASPDLFGFSGMTEVAAARDLASCFRGPQAAAWEAFRDSPEARFVVLTLPRILARAPYGSGGRPVAEFPFEEFVEGAGPREGCWMSAAWALVERVAAAQARDGWPARIFGPVGGKVEGLPLGNFPTDTGEVASGYPAEAALSESRAPELATLGLLPLVRGPGGEAFFAGPATCHRPAAGETADRLDALLCAARFVHYLSILARDRASDPAEAKECERWLNRWLEAFVAADPGTASLDILARQPLAEARVQVRPTGDKSRAFEVVAWLRPCHALPSPYSTFHFVAKVPRRM